MFTVYYFDLLTYERKVFAQSDCRFQAQSSLNDALDMGLEAEIK